MNPPISVLMLDGQAPYALLVARCLTRAPGLRLHVLSLSGRALVRHTRGLASFELMPALPDDTARLELVREVVRRKGIDIVLGSSEDAIDFISANRSELDGACATVASPGRSDLAIARDKWLLSRHLAINAIPHPETLLVTDGPELDFAVRLMKPPLLLKPVGESGGEGILFFAGCEELLAYVRSAPPSKKSFIVQEFCAGRDAGCNVLCRDGKILVSTVQKSIVPNAARFGSPSCIDVAPDEHILAVVAHLMKSLNWSGVANVDVKLDEACGSVTVLEINPRYWGSVLASLFAGVNFPHLACLEGLGVPMPDLNYKPVRFTWHKRKIIAGFLAPGGRVRIESRGSVLRYIVPDPVPELVNLGRMVLLR